MRCLYCGKQLALLRRLTGGGEFCSEAHKQSYHEESNKLALSRLMEAQSKPDDYKRSEPEADHAVEGAPFPEHTKRIAARGSEQGWTTVQRSSQKRLPAPTAKAALPAAPISKAAPAKANFLADKPRLQVPQGLELPTMVVAPELVARELCLPRLSCKPDEFQTSQPPSKAGLVDLSNAPAFAKPESRPATGEPVFMEHSPGTIRIDLTLSTRSIAGFAPAELLPFEYHSAGQGTGKAEPALQPAYAFDFQPILGHAPSNVAAGPPAPVDNSAPLPEGRLLDLLPLHIRPVPVGSRYRSPWSEQIPMRTLTPEFPGDIPLTLRPRVAASDPAPASDRVKVPARPTRGTVKLNLARPERDQPVTSKGPEAPCDVAAGRAAVASEDDLPKFLKGQEGQEAEKSVWGSVQRYLKNFVGCLLFAILGGGYFGDASATKVLKLANGGAELSGEADRAKPARQIFVYPASLGLQDYRVDFEAPLAGEGTVWVFRVADPRNYYGMRLEPERDDGAVRWKIQKYVEVNGEQILSGTVRLVRTPPTTYCRVMLEVEGSKFRTYMQGRLVDQWTDARFSRGGFGYYGGAGEPLPIRAVHVRGLEPASGPGVYRHD